MPQLECRELGVDCDEVITGATAEEVKQKALAHAQEKHADVLASLSPEQQAGMGAQIDAAIR
jgi:predicted small metal-binding protein